MMKVSTILKKATLFSVLFHLTFLVFAQDIIQLPYEKPDNVTWKNPEKEYYTNEWQTQVITNVSIPLLEVFQPSEEIRNGAAVIIAPGGGLYALSINSEGIDVANWLVKKGITAFVLKYRLVPTGEDGVHEINQLMQNTDMKLYEEVAKVMPFSVADGLNSIAYVREHASEFGIDRNKIGFMGFSAGGAVTMGVAYRYSDENRPDFLVPVYAWTDAMPVQEPRKDAPPILVICANDDQLGLAPGSVAIYNSWHKNGISAALHMYSKGGHGFGMRINHLPSDRWIERFYDWFVAESFVEP